MRVEKGRGPLPCQFAGGLVELGPRRLVEPVLCPGVDMELRNASALHERLLGASHVVKGFEFVLLREVTEDRRHGPAGLDFAQTVIADESVGPVRPRLRKLPAIPDAHAPREHRDALGLCAELGERFLCLSHGAFLVQPAHQCLRPVDGRRDAAVIQVRSRDLVALAAQSLGVRAHVVAESPPGVQREHSGAHVATLSRHHSATRSAIIRRAAPGAKSWSPPSMIAVRCVTRACDSTSAYRCAFASGTWVSWLPQMRSTRARVRVTSASGLKWSSSPKRAGAAASTAARMRESRPATSAATAPPKEKPTMPIASGTSGCAFRRRIAPPASARALASVMRGGS